MTRSSHDRLRAASRLYARVLWLYPRAHRETFGEQMLRTFDDSLRAVANTDGRVPAAFWIEVIWDALGSLAREYLLQTDGQLRVDRIAAGLVVLCATAGVVLPFVDLGSGWAWQLVPAAVIGALLLASGRSGGAFRSSVLTVASSLLALLLAILVGESVNDVADVVGPVTVVCSLVLGLKTLSGGAWTRTELNHAVGLGALGVAGLVPGALTSADLDGFVKFVFYVVIPLVCSVVGSSIGWSSRSRSDAVISALSALVGGAMVWVVTRSVLLEVQLGANVGGWRSALSNVLLPACLLCVAGAALGRVARETDSARASRPT